MRTAKPHPARVGAIFGLKPRMTLGSARAGGVSPHKSTNVGTLGRIGLHMRTGSKIPRRSNP
jgi:hypothetical protein